MRKNTRGNYSTVDGLAAAIHDRLRQHFGTVLPRTVVTSMIVVIGALIPLAVAPCGWYGRLSLSAVARSMCSRGSVKSRFKRLSRMLNNRRFDLLCGMQGLVSFSGVTHLQGLTPLLIDQTSVCKNAIQAIVASVVHGTRSIPIAVETYEYAGITGSQNSAEWALISRVCQLVKDSLRIVVVMDRGYAKYFLLEKLLKHGRLFIVRGCRSVVVHYHDERGTPRRAALGRLPHRQGVPVRYRNVRYRDGGSLLVDIIVFRGRGFTEPWFLIVPSDSENQLPTQMVVEWYRWRMRIEVTFRDFKSCLGLRKGIHLEAGSAQRMARMLICVAVVYIILIAMGESDSAVRMRKEMEICRKRPRHGTRRTLSVLTVTLLVLSQVLIRSSEPPVSQVRRLMESWTHGLFSIAFAEDPDT